MYYLRKNRKMAARYYLGAGVFLLLRRATGEPNSGAAEIDVFGRHRVPLVDPSIDDPSYTRESALHQTASISISLPTKHITAGSKKNSRKAAEQSQLAPSQSPIVKNVSRLHSTSSQNRAAHPPKPAMNNRDVSTGNASSFSNAQALALDLIAKANASTANILKERAYERLENVTRVPTSRSSVHQLTWTSIEVLTLATVIGLAWLLCFVQQWHGGA